VVADDAFEPLTEASSDSSNAKTLFILLGTRERWPRGRSDWPCSPRSRRPAAARTRCCGCAGATDGQLARLAAAQAGLAWVVGSVLGLLVAGAAVSAITGKLVWQDVPSGSLVVTIVLALAVGAMTTTVRLVGVLRVSRRPVAAERLRLEHGWQPLWRRAWLDLAAITVGATILLINIAAGGLKQIPIEPDQGSTLALRFYVLLGLMFLWVGLTLLAVRLLLARFAAWGRPQPSGSLSSWPNATVRPCRSWRRSSPTAPSAPPVKEVVRQE